MNEIARKITAFEARTHLGEMLDFIRYSKKPCFIERHGKTVAVLLDYESYQSKQITDQYQTWIERAVEQIKIHYHPEKIILFGSVARSEFKEGSDIDLLIVKKTPKRKLDRVDEILDFLDPTIPVECHIYTPKELEKKIKEEDLLLNEILKTGKILYEA